MLREKDVAGQILVGNCINCTLWRFSSVAAVVCVCVVMKVLPHYWLIKERESRLGLGSPHSPEPALWLANIPEEFRPPKWLVPKTKERERESCNQVSYLVLKGEKNLSPSLHFFQPFHVSRRRTGLQPWAEGTLWRFLWHTVAGWLCVLPFLSLVVFLSLTLCFF